MSLIDVKFPVADGPLPADVRTFLREADHRIEEFQRHARVPGFVASDFPRVYQVLRSMSSANLTPGNLFCEWGSGFGVVTCLAAMLDFDAVGIEIDDELVDAAQTLADDFGVPVEFVRGSFIPKGGEGLADVKGGLAWLVTEESARTWRWGSIPTTSTSSSPILGPTKGVSPSDCSSAMPARRHCS